MHSQNQIPLFLFSFLISLPTLISQSNPKFSEPGLICGSSRSPNGPAFIRNFVNDMEALLKLVSSNRWGAHASGSSPNSSVYGLAQCRSDLSQTDCLLCFAQSRTKLPTCLPSNSARIFLDGCFLRYDNYSFYSEAVDDRRDKSVCGSKIVFGEDEKKEFAMNVEGLIQNLIEMAVKNKGFGVGEEMVGKGIGGVYGLGQCWKSVSLEGCRECLEKAGREAKGCLPASEGRGLNAGCYLRYSTEKFYNDVNMEEGTKHGGNSHMVIILAVASSVAVVALLSTFGFCVGYARLTKRRQEFKNLAKLSSTKSKSNLSFKYETLEKATNFFDPKRKLGQGGAGSVYKGTLPDGRIVAVKRLFFSTRQWVDEFFNEVNLISGVEHKNLVKLLGCSIEGPESLLVYEHVPNKSLDHFLFNKKKTETLSWQQRFEIIIGTAEGLAYLHEGSETRIIHRDIKTSNILLDENLKAKIADFGLARCFSADKTHLSTGIAGTLGYMAPEYLVRGQLTEKADVYSFGVLVFEIVSGRQTSVYMQNSRSILEMVWKHYKSNTLVECVDQCLKDNFPAKEASGVLQIGLLCTQASVALRPSMSAVVQMLTDKECTIPLPKQPPFLNASVVHLDTPSFSSSFPSSSSPATSSRCTFDTSGPR
ncbi:cysteine-rich receptor-like protein kinase 42 [Tasmannia lanceolata]|uniref:cysteine-rich receptor-like protein kinase 42 n=1 Tax=Tasmannia lanceolata TaxID=3420 RepID=UPI004063B0F7